MKIWKQKPFAAVISIKGILIFTVLFVTSFLFTACITTKKQAGVSSVALLPFWGPDQIIVNRFEKEVYAAMKNMKSFSPVLVNTDDIPIPYEIPDPSLIGGNDYALTGELSRDPDDSDFWVLRLYLWKEKRLIFSDLVNAYDREELAAALPNILEFLFSWTERKEYPAKNTTVSSVGRTQSVALVPFWGSNQNAIGQFVEDVYAAMGNMKDFRPVMIDMTNLPYDVPEGGFPPYVCPSPSLIKTNSYALTGEVTRTVAGSWDLRLYLWEMETTRLVFTSTLTARNRNECRSLLPGLLDKLFSQLYGK
jgi:hypothetical protein